VPEPGSQAKLRELEERWRTDHSPRVFLPLADELRRFDRLSEAITVLAKGLEHHADSVSGLVAIGRCLLDAGDARRAAGYLERAIDRDPTQLVANKLLAESRIRLGDAAGARERLEVCRLLGGRDADLEGMERRLGELAPQPSGDTTPTVLPAAANLASFETPIFDLSSPARLPELSLARPTARRAANPFGELFEPAASRRRIAARLQSDGIFLRGVAANAPASATTAPPATAVEPVAPLAPLFFPRQAIGEAVEREAEGATWSLADGPEIELAPEVTAGPVAAEPSASVTLAALYLEQGHLDEAEAEYRQVLARRSDDAAALAGLASIVERRRPPRTPIEPPPAPPGGLTQRKVARLRGALEQLRRQREGSRRVS
jgi:tetratricopeptide (TPR) repeat protein